ncbi:hypothetical protein [Megalodesulfovibrio paquesii]
MEEACKGGIAANHNRHEAEYEHVVSFVSLELDVKLNLTDVTIILAKYRGFPVQNLATKKPIISEETRSYSSR